MVSLLLLSPAERYRDLLTGRKKKIQERVPQHFIANYFGIRSVSLSRIRNRGEVVRAPRLGAGPRTLRVRK